MDRLWQLYVTDDAGGWTPVGVFDCLADIALRINAMEEREAVGLFFEVHVDAATSDAIALGHLEHRGRRHVYVARHMVQ